MAPSSTPLRWRARWIALGAALMLTVGLVALLPFTRQLIGMAMAIPDGDKLLHALAFVVLMLWWGNVYRRRDRRLAAAFGCLLFGVLIECAQWPHSPRDASGYDVLADAIGLTLGLWLLRTPLADVLAKAEVRLRSG